ncbi:MAG TPA: hypothetical protein VNT55_24135 [Baekduia sp.]|nr:hypothetical protein [Baekduia sp.]
MSSRARIGIVVGAVIVLVVAFVVASGSGDDDNNTTAATTPAATQPAGADTTATTATPPPPAPSTPVITVRDGKPVGGIKKLKYNKGNTIRFTVESDTTDEIHFHGYDIGKDVKAGGSVTFTTTATIEGRFVVELEGSGTQIAEVEVDPS